MILEWSTDKNLTLIRERSVSFEQVQAVIEDGMFRIISPHPNKKKYPNQILLLVLIDSYIFVVPAVPSENGYYLKTIYPSRKYTKAYLKGELII